MVITRYPQDRWKWFLPAPRSSLNPPGPSTKAKNLSFRTRNFREKFGKKSLLALLTPFFWDPPGQMADGSRYVAKWVSGWVPRPDHGRYPETNIRAVNEKLPGEFVHLPGGVPKNRAPKKGLIRKLHTMLTPYI